jgi:hypothetical protein
MWLGAMIDAGADVGRVQSAIDALDLGDVSLEIAEPEDGHESWGTHVDVVIGPDARRVPTLAEAQTRIEARALDGEVARRASAVYRRLAEAEARTHGVAVDEVVFHELGDPDTAADIVGVCAAVVDLGLDRITCGPIALGSGTVRTAHGELTVPVPAVTDLLQDFVVVAGTARRELTTPTGAALAATLAEPLGSLPPMRLTGQGRGSGDRRADGRSVLTLLIGERVGDTAPGADEPDQFYIVETTVDDLQPEFVPDVLDRLRGLPETRDAWATPVLMKKGRPGFTLSALVGGHGGVQPASDVLFREAGTLGVRTHPVARQALERQWVTVEVEGVAIQVKIAGPVGAPTRIAPEHDDVAAAAVVLGRPVREIYEIAASMARQHATLDTYG